MPKKTKKEKLLAQQHRTKRAPVKHFSPSPISAQLSQPAAFSFTLPTTQQPKAKTAAATYDEYGLIKRDLIKTVILTTIILMGEFLLTNRLPR